MFQEPFYWVYLFCKKFKTNTNPAQSAYLVICVLQQMNILSIVIIIKYFFKIEETATKSDAVYIGTVLFFILLTVNWFQLYSKREEIFHKYENLTDKRKKIGKYLSLLYELLSLFLLFYLGAYIVTPRY